MKTITHTRSIHNRRKPTARQLEVLSAIGLLGGNASSKRIKETCLRQRHGETVEACQTRTAWLRVGYAAVRLSQICAQLLLRGLIRRSDNNRGRFSIAPRQLRLSA